jgi:hypothetical protein
VLFQYLLWVSREPVDVIGNFFGKIFFLTMGIKLTLASQTKKEWVNVCLRIGETLQERKGEGNWKEKQVKERKSVTEKDIEREKCKKEEKRKR